jgi:hypothetical protein
MHSTWGRALSRALAIEAASSRAIITKARRVTLVAPLLRINGAR